jgi:hypothetical protein
MNEPAKHGPRLRLGAAGRQQPAVVVARDALLDDAGEILMRGERTRFDGRAPVPGTGGGRPRVLVLWGAGGRETGTADVAAAREATPGWDWLERDPSLQASPDLWAELGSADVRAAGIAVGGLGYLIRRSERRGGQPDKSRWRRYRQRDIIDLMVRCLGHPSMEIRRQAFCEIVVNVDANDRQEVASIFADMIFQQPRFPG